MRIFTRMENTACAPEYVCEHGHYDHGGGLAAFLEINDHASRLHLPLHRPARL